MITYDADLPYPLSDMPRLLTALEQGAAVATASPWHAEGAAEGVPAGRVGLSRLASLAYRLRFRGAAEQSTWTCGFRAWKKAAFLRCLPRRDGFVATAEMLVRARVSDLPIAELPSILGPRKDGFSKMRTLRTARAHLGLLLGGPGAPVPTDAARGRSGTTPPGS